jgi:Tfp pilus assembly protein PilP
MSWMLAAALGAQSVAPPAAPTAPAPAPGPAAAPAPGTTTPAVDSQAAPEAYAYDPAGRRDPFVGLLGSGDAQNGLKKGDGPASLGVSDISVRGVMQSRGALIAMVQGPDNRTYIVHPGDKLADGTIKTITPQGLVVIQDVHDPLSLVKQREVRKLLRGFEENK